MIEKADKSSIAVPVISGIETEFHYWPIGTLCSKADRFLT
jgi:hypothetical protein